MRRDGLAISKKSRFREKTWAEQHPLYLVMLDAVPTPDDDNNLQHEDNISNTGITDTKTKAEVLQYYL